MNTRNRAATRMGGRPTFPQRSDQELMSAVRDGDARAFEDLFARHRATAYETALAILRSDHLAEDVAQETFLSIWKGRATFRPRAEASVGGWVRNIARNRAIDVIRQGTARKRPQTLYAGPTELPDPGSESAIEDLLERDELLAWRGRLVRSLRSLPTGQAEVIMLSFIRGLSHSEIATRLALPEGTVKGRIRLGRARMRTGLAAEDRAADEPSADPVADAAG